MSDPVYLEVKAILDTLVECNEQWQKSKCNGDKLDRTEAVITQQFLRDKLRVLVQQIGNFDEDI